MEPDTTESLLTSGDQANTAEAGGHVDATPTADTATGAQPGETKPVEGEAPKPETGDEKAEGEKEGEQPAGAPEQYEPFTVPEGLQLDEQLFNEFTPVLKELNLSQEAAQKVVDFAPKLIEKTVAQTQAAVLNQLGMADVREWANKAKEDKEIGGERFPENIALANKALSAFGSPELVSVLKKTGLGNHPELVRAFVKIGKQISEDSFVPGGKNTTGKPNLYDKSNMNP